VLPSNYSEIVARGIAALSRAEAELRTLADTESAPPDPWHTIRDLHGLNQRLATCDEWQWRMGFARVNFAPTDPALLDELARAQTWRSPYRDTQIELFDAGDRVALAEMHRFLAAYISDAFEFEDIDPRNQSSHRLKVDTGCPLTRTLLADSSS
jgi:hypothetical protein